MSEQAVLLEFFAQGVAVDTEQVAGARLIACGLFHHHLKHGAFNGAQHHVIDGAGVGAVEIPKVFLEIECNGFIDGRLARPEGSGQACFL